MVQHRSLKLRLAELLKDKLPNVKIAAHAQSLGVSDTTLRKYLRDEALVLDRRVLEKACDYLGVGIQELLDLVPSRFFPERSGRIRMVRGRYLDVEDYKTISALIRFFANSQLEEHITEDPADIVSSIRSHDCLIVGSPRKNPAGELALCELFQVQHGDTSKEGRRRLPLIMQVPEEWHPPTSMVQGVAKLASRTQCQVLAPDSANETDSWEARAYADYYPQETFWSTEVKSGRDFGVLFVADRETADADGVVSHRRIYWISGFSSVGTEAANLVLQSDFRTFSVEPGEYVLAVIQATYSKAPNSDVRELLQDPKIAHTVRGKLPAAAATSAPSTAVIQQPETPAGGSSQLDGAVQEPIHSARLQKFRTVAKSTWRTDLSNDGPALSSFYDSELRRLSEDAFATTLTRLEENYATLPKDRRPQSLDRFLRRVIEARDDDVGSLFRNQ